MTTTLGASPRRLSDSELISRVKDLVVRERQATTALVMHLAELDERKLYRAEGCSSLFTYCLEILHLSEHAAYSRIEAARAGNRLPVVFEMLAQGAIHLTAIGLIGKYLTDENHHDLLARVSHRTKREIEEIVAAIRPREAVASSVRKAPVRTAAAPAPAGNAATHESSTDADLSGAPLFSVECAPAASATAAGKRVAEVRSGDPPALTPAPPRAKVAPLAPDLYSVRFTADSETYRNLCQARELLKHQVPDGDAAAVIGLALKLLVKNLAQRKIGTGKRHATSGATKPVPGGGRRPESERLAISEAETRVISESKPRAVSNRYIPASVRRHVWERDAGRCAFVGRNGHRCTERGRLEFHHIEPFAQGGAATVENLQLRCRAHNAFESELIFGPHRLGPEKLENVMERDESGNFPAAPPPSHER